MDPHAASLPLFAAIQKMEGNALPRAAQELDTIIKTLKLKEHIDVALIIDVESSVSLEPRTDFGHEVLAEVSLRTVLPPCPDGDHEYGPEGYCIWCDRPRLEV